MSRDWAAYVAEHQLQLQRSGSKRARALLSLYDLVLNYEGDGLIGYLLGFGADSLPDLEECFQAAQFTDGVLLLKAVHQKYGGQVSPDRDVRLEVISKMPGFDDGIDPFDAEDQSLSALLPRIERLASELATALARGSAAR